MRALHGPSSQSDLPEDEEEEDDRNVPVDKDGTILASDPIKPL